LLENFAEVRPTFVMAVPRIYEKVYATVWQRAMGGAATRALFHLPAA
jgi:long-subunit acyl-CoA synthetase (AMP-forming)